ncbi:hypothetical protein HDV02_003444 [Globomyces sp. JEL0801]|nr:hypothetical protein HDV02_003444 [Globomyces sp. JEL0801]
MRDILVVGLFDYQSTDPNALCFTQGDVIQVLTRLPSGWWDGVLNGKRGTLSPIRFNSLGWFPSNYVSAPEQSQIVSTPDEVVEDEILAPVKTLENGKHYYFNLLTNETKWSITGQKLDGNLTPDYNISLDMENVDQQDHTIVYTWPGLSTYTISKIRKLLRETNEKSKEKYLGTASTIVEAIRIMFLVSNCSTKESEILQPHQNLRKDHAQILNCIARVILAAKLASAIWPPPDANDKLLQSADELARAVRQFTTEAAALNLQIKVPKANELAEYQKNSDNEHQHKKMDIELIAQLEEVVLDIVSAVSVVNIQHEPVATDDGSPKSIVTSSLASLDLVKAMKDIISKIGTFLALIDTLPLDSLFEDLTIDYKVNRLTLLNCVTDLVMAAQNNALNKTPKDQEKVLLAIELVEKSAKDLLISTKFLVEEKENMENSTLKTYIEQYSVPGPQTAQKGIRHAASTTFSEAQSRPASMSTHSDQSRQNILYPDARQRRPSLVTYESNYGSPIPDMKRLSMSNRVSMAYSGTGSDGQSNSPLLERFQLPYGDGRRTSASRSTRISHIKHQDAWYMKPDYANEDLMYNNDGLVKGGTLSALIAKLTSHENPDDYFVSCFLMTYRTFTTTKEFFNMLEARFVLDIPNNLTEDELFIWSEYKLKPIRQRVYAVLKAWLEYHIQDTPEDRLILDELEIFSETVMKPYMAISSQTISRLIEKRKMHGLKPFRTTLQGNRDKAPLPILPKNVRKFKLFEIDPLELARQLTIIESQLFQNIETMEFLAKSWGLANFTSPNVEEMISMANQITNWVSFSILQVPESKKRARAIGFFITLADRCASLNNFNSMMAILASFNSAPIHRLAKTWDQVSHQYLDLLDALRSLMSSEKNFQTYRSALRQTSPPCIPFLGFYLTDLTFIKDATTSHLKAFPNLINFSKMMRTADVLKDTIKFRSTYSLKSVPEIESFLMAELKANHEDQELYDLSLKQEARRGAEDEKMKTLLTESGLF